MACQDLATADATTGCIKCAKAVQPPAMEVFYNGIKATTKAETCAACYASGIDTDA
jgi:hypothetical protein